jgi:hypothetical protein
MRVNVGRVAFDDSDPRFAELVAYLAAIQQRGRYSPTPRIVAEWALLGFLLTTGTIAVGVGAGGEVAVRGMTESLGVPDPAALAQAQRAVAQALDDLFC